MSIKELEERRDDIIDETYNTPPVNLHSLVDHPRSPRQAMRSSIPDDGAAGADGIPAFPAKTFVPYFSPTVDTQRPCRMLLYDHFILLDLPVPLRDAVNGIDEM